MLAMADSTNQGIDGAIQAVIEGKSQYIAPRSGQSRTGKPFEGDPPSISGLAALNFARIALERECGGLTGISLLRSLVQKELVEDVLSVCSRWSSPAQLDVDDIAGTPIFDKSLVCLWSESQYTQPDIKQIQNMLGRVQYTIESSAALLVTRSHESICVLKIVTATKDIFVAFNSATSRRDPGTVVLFPSLESAATFLLELLKDDPYSPGISPNAQTKLCTRVFVAKKPVDDPTDLRDAILQSTLDLLALKAEMRELKRVNEELQSAFDSLTRELSMGRARVGPNPFLSRYTLPRQVENTFPNLNGGSWHRVAAPTKKGKEKAGGVVRFPSPALADMAKVEDDFALATRLQRDWQDDMEKSARLAAERQWEFEQEDEFLRIQMQELQNSLPSTFNCGICLEEEPEFSVARVESCRHEFCRDCIRDYIRSKLEERRFPIQCPICVADKDRTDPGIVASTLLQEVGLTEEEYGIYSELELAGFSVLLQCRGCGRSVFVDRSEYNAENILSCPLPNCKTSWCKNCSQLVVEGGPAHSCDGTTELNHLMSQQGWKYCPGCRTPAEKINGCNHLSCPSPGCNTHFCYFCGATIIKSAVGAEVAQAKSAHYTRCRIN